MTHGAVKIEISGKGQREVQGASQRNQLHVENRSYFSNATESSPVNKCRKESSKSLRGGNSLVQRSRLWAFTAEGPGSIPSQRHKDSHTPCGAVKKKKKLSEFKEIMWKINQNRLSYNLQEKWEDWSWKNCLDTLLSCLLIVINLLKCLHSYENEFKLQ